MKTINDILAELKTAVDATYETGVTMPEAEKHAFMALSRTLFLADELKTKSLDAKMKKHGAKAVRAAVYMEEIKKHEKKPAEAYLDHAINLSPLVEQAERASAEAEVSVDHLWTYIEVLKEFHIHNRGIAKGDSLG